MTGARDLNTTKMATCLHPTNIRLTGLVNHRAVYHYANKPMPKTISERAPRYLLILHPPREATHPTVPSRLLRKRHHCLDNHLVLRAATVPLVGLRWMIAGRATIPIVGLIITPLHHPLHIPKRRPSPRPRVLVHTPTLHRTLIIPPSQLLTHKRHS